MKILSDLLLAPFHIQERHAKLRSPRAAFVPSQQTGDMDRSVEDLINTSMGPPLKSGDNIRERRFAVVVGEIALALGGLGLIAVAVQLALKLFNVI
jgi:hypothetical protein